MRVDTDATYQNPAQSLLHEELGPLAFLTLLPTSCLNVVPTNLIEIRKIGSVFKSRSPEEDPDQ